jgi:hypothetical protein
MYVNTYEYFVKYYLNVNNKVMVPHNRPEGPEGIEVKSYSFLTSALEGSGWSAPRPGRFTPWKDRVPIVKEAGCAPGPVWTCAKNLAPIIIIIIRKYG